MAKKKLSDLTPNEKNPRKISDEKLRMLKASLEEYGDLSGFVFNRKTKRLAGGHQRLKVMPQDSELIIEREFEKPTKTGTVAEGRAVVNGESFTYREVEWDEIREKAANIAANNHGGEWELVGLNAWIKELQAAEYDMDLVGFSPEELDKLLNGEQ